MLRGEGERKVALHPLAEILLICYAPTYNKRLFFCRMYDSIKSIKILLHYEIMRHVTTYFSVCFLFRLLASEMAFEREKM
jgi:hypothetical protein